MDINELLQAVGLQSERSASTAAAITGNYEAIQSIGERRAVNAAAMGESDAIVAEQKAKGELQAQENARRFATAAGTNMDVNTEILSSLGAEYKTAAMETIRAKDVVAKKSAVSLFDDPLTYIINQITIGDDINYAEAAEAKSNQISSSIAQLNQATQATVLSQNAIAQTETAATVEAVADSVRRKAAEQADVIKTNNLLYNVKGLQDIQALNQQQLSNMFSAKTAVNAEISLQNAQEQLKISRANAKIALEERMERLEAKQASAAEVDEAGATINKGRAILGLPPIPAGKAFQMMKIGGALGESIKDQYAKGAVAESTGVSVISDQPGKAAMTVAQSQAPLAPGMKPVRDLMMESLSDVAQGRVKPASGLPVDPKNLAAVTEATNGVIKGRAAQMAGNIKLGDSNNIYAAPSIPSLLKAAPAIAKTELYKTVLEPLVTNGMSELNPEQLIFLGTDAVLKGQIKFNTVVQDIKTLYSAAAAVNNAVKDYPRVGLPLQTTFNTTVPVKNPKTWEPINFVTTQNVKANLLDTTQITALMTKQMVASRSNKISFDTLGLGTIDPTLGSPASTYPSGGPGSLNRGNQ